MLHHWIQLQLGNKKYIDKVSTEGCEDVDDFRVAIKSTFPRLLDSYAPHHLTLFQPDGITEIDPETKMNDVFVTAGKPLIVKVDEPAPIAKQLENPPSSTRHQDHKQSKAFVSSRSYLTSIALELDKIYPKNRSRELKSL